MTDPLKNLANKRVILGVTGGIAAYKSADLARRLREAGAQVQVVMTPAAQEFITPLTMQAVSGHPVHDDLLDRAAEAGMGHIELARWADLILIAPATADFIARMAYGFANDLLTTLCLATAAPIAIAPAMNQAMWLDPATQANVQLLKTRQIKIFGPGEGEQACGDVGPGRMLEPLALVSLAAALFQTGELAGKHVVITAGPTHEAIDPVRYFTNHSSGKMGFALAEAAAAVGAQVTLISGPVHLASPARVARIDVVTAEEMYTAVMQAMPACDIFIAAAAVADYRCAAIADRKIPRQAEEVTLHLIKNIDILASVATLNPPPFTVGLAAQTEEVAAMAARKLTEKKINMIAANQVGVPGRGFQSDDNAFTVLWPGGAVELNLRSKQQLARDLMTLIAKRYAIDVR